MLIKLHNIIRINVSLCTPINVSKCLTSTVNYEIQQSALLLDRGIRHIGSELLNLMYNIPLEIWEVSAYNS